MYRIIVVLHNKHNMFVYVLSGHLSFLIFIVILQVTYPCIVQSVIIYQAVLGKTQMNLQDKRKIYLTLLLSIYIIFDM